MNISRSAWAIIIALVVVIVILISLNWNFSALKSEKPAEVDSTTKLVWPEVPKQVADSINALNKTVAEKQLIIDEFMKNWCKKNLPTKQAPPKKEVKPVVAKSPNSTVTIIVKNETGSNVSVTPNNDNSVYITPKIDNSDKAVYESPVNRKVGKFVEFAIQLNDNYGNWFPQIAVDAGENINRYHNAVMNNTKDGYNLRFYESEWTDGFDNDYGFTKDGVLYFKASVFGEYLNTEIIKSIGSPFGWSGLKKLEKDGDYYILSTK